MSTVSISGLRKISNFETTLAAATKDEQKLDGTINPYLALEATRIINNPEFQRVKDRLSDDLAEQEKNHIEQRQFQDSVRNLSIEARVNRSDLDYIVRNLQQPQPAPQPARPSTDAAADNARIQAELARMNSLREHDLRQQATAQQAAAHLAAQRSQTPAQNIINHYVSQPTYLQQNVQSVTNQVRQMGMTFQQFVMQQQGGQSPFGRAAPPSQGGDRPGPYTAIANTSGGGQPPTSTLGVGLANGASSSSQRALPTPPDYYTPDQRLDYYLAIQQGRRPPNVPRPRRPAASSRMGASASALPGGAIVPSSQSGVGAGRDSRDLRAAANDRMQRLGHSRAQGRRRQDMVQRGLDADRARRRGPAVGDVVGTGKRKRNLDGMPEFQPRQRVAREQYSIAT